MVVILLTLVTVLIHNAYLLPVHTLNLAQEVWNNKQMNVVWMYTCAHIYNSNVVPKFASVVHLLPYVDMENSFYSSKISAS